MVSVIGRYKSKVCVRLIRDLRDLKIWHRRRGKASSLRRRTRGCKSDDKHLRPITCAFGTEVNWTRKPTRLQVTNLARCQPNLKTAMACKKQKYKSKKIARQARAAVERKYGHDFYIYRCPVCLKFHLSGRARTIFQAQGSKNARKTGCRTRK